MAPVVVGSRFLQVLWDQFLGHIHGGDDVVPLEPFGQGASSQQLQLPVLAHLGVGIGLNQLQQLFTRGHEKRGLRAPRVPFRSRSLDLQEGLVDRLDASVGGVDHQEEPGAGLAVSCGRSNHAGEQVTTTHQVGAVGELSDSVV